MRTKTAKFLLALSLALAACRAPAPSAPAPTPVAAILPATSAPTVAAIAAPTATRAAPPAAPTGLPTPSQSTALTFNAPDGAALAALYYPPIVRPAPGVLLLHMLGGSKADWDAFARSLQRQGYAALAIDLRGSGASAKPEDWTKAPDDVRGAWQLLSARPEVDPNRTAIVGASIGANLALMVGGGQARVNAVAALSPGLDFHGLNPSSAMKNFGERPVYLVASQDDTYSFNSVQTLASLSISAETLTFKTAGHGTAMFNDPGLAPALMKWLNQHVRDLK